MKHDKEKYIPTLTYTSLLKEISKVRSYGKKKYGSYDDWKTTEVIQHLNAAVRHIRDVIDGEDFDQGSGYLHLSHAACNIMFEIERFLNIDEDRVTIDGRIFNTCFECEKQLEPEDYPYGRCLSCRIKREEQMKKERLELEKMRKR